MLRKLLNSFTITSLILFSLILASCKKSSSSDNSSSDEFKPLVNNITASLAAKAKNQPHLGDEFHTCIEHYGKNPDDNAEYCSPYNAPKQKKAEDKARASKGKTVEEMEVHVSSLIPKEEGDAGDPQTIAQNTDDNVHVLHKISSTPADQGTEMTQIIADNIKKYPVTADKSHDFSNFFYAEEGYAGKKVRLAGFWGKLTNGLL